MKLKGIVLAGGMSRRFGADKALALLNGKTLIEKTFSLLKENHLDPVVMINQEKDYSMLDYPIERDIIPDKGPLGGLYTACRLFKGFSLVVATCDMPNMTGRVLKRLLKHHQSGSPITVFRLKQGKTQPFPGVYESDLAEQILEWLEREQLSMQSFIRSHSNACLVPWRFYPEKLYNVNERPDLVRLQQKS
jgi:molybdenum cofactor guanylyltransferase